MPLPYLTITQSAKLCINLGSFNINMKVCPFQPALTATKKGPRFFNMDATGGFYGLSGFYRSIPCWTPYFTTYRPYQTYTFSVNATGWFDCDGTMPNPFAYQAQLTDSGVVAGQLSYMGFFSSPASAAAVQGPNGLYLSNQTQVNAFSGAPAYVTSRVSCLCPEITPLNFLNTKIPNINTINPNDFITSGFMPPTGDGASQIINAPGNPFLLHDNVLGSYGLVDSSIYTYSQPTYGTTSFKQAWSDFPQRIAVSTVRPVLKYISFNPVMSLGSTSYFSVYNVKVNPIDGTFLAFSLSCNYTGISISSKLVHGSTIGDPVLSVLTLSNAADNTLLATNLYSVIQIPGGGYILFNESAVSVYSGFYFLPDCSGYYSISFTGIPTAQLYGVGGSHVPEQIGVDLNGNFYLLGYPSGTFGSLYWSGPGPWTVLLSTPQLAMAGVICKSNACFPWGV